MLHPVTDTITRKLRLPRGLSAVFVVILLIGLLFSFLIWFLPTIYTDLETFARQLPDYAAWLLEKLDLIGKQLNIDLSAANLYEQGMAKLQESGSMLIRWLGNMVGSVQHLVAVSANIILIPVIAFFAMADYPKIEKFLDDYIGKSHDQGLRKYLSLFSRIMSSYFRGQFIVMAILAVLYTVALKIAGLNMALLLGVTSGLLSIVPYLGFAIGIVSSVLMAAIQFQDIWHPLYVILGYGIVQVIESFFVTPKVMSGTLGLHPLATIIILLIGGATFGLLGMIFSLPIAAALFTLYRQRFEDLYKKTVSDGTTSSDEQEDPTNSNL